MTSVPAHHAAGPRPHPAHHVDDLDAQLRRAVRHAAAARQAFYVVVLLVALAGQVSGAVARLDIPLGWAIPAVAGLELGGIVVLSNADVRRRLGERATASRLLSALIACGAVAFNWEAHGDHLLGAFFAGMSALGYLVWLMHTENQRRDRLRATGDLPATTPAYELVEHWLRHPMLTLRAKSLAKADPGLGLYASVAAARDQVRRQRRHAAIARVLHRKIRAAVDPAVADIAVAVYDLGEIAARLAEGADYDGLTALINADLAPARLTGGATRGRGGGAENAAPLPAAGASADPTPPDPTNDTPDRSCPAGPAAASPGDPAGSPPPPPVNDANVIVYQPTSREDAAMYAAWQRAVAAGQEPSGADLARAAGRADDATGGGRRAARRYRDAHAAFTGTTPPGGDSPPARRPRPHNGQQPNLTGAR